jgi:TctA family transporter
MESYLRRSLIVSHGNVLALVARPISGGMLLLSAVILAWTFRKRIKAQPKQTNRVDGTIVGRC